MKALGNKVKIGGCSCPTFLLAAPSGIFRYLSFILAIALYAKKEENKFSVLKDIPNFTYDFPIIGELSIEMTLHNHDSKNASLYFLLFGLLIFILDVLQFLMAFFWKVTEKTAELGRSILRFLFDVITFVGLIFCLVKISCRIYSINDLYNHETWGEVIQKVWTEEEKFWAFLYYEDADKLSKGCQAMFAIATVFIFFEVILSFFRIIKAIK